MTERLGLWTCLVLSMLVPPARAQESVRDLSGSGPQNKFLTPNQLDHWLFEGEKGETILAHVVSRDFDPILELARSGAKEEKLLLEVDDPGSESRFAVRLPEKGKFEIRVHAFKFQGGGNYTLRVQRFQARPLAMGESIVGTLDRDGKGYHYFHGVKDQWLVPELRGLPAEGWKSLDYKGRESRGWCGTVFVEDEGEGYLMVSGPPEQHYELRVREAGRHTVGEKDAGTLQQGEAGVWSFQGKPGDFRMLEIQKTGKLQARLVFAPLQKQDAPQLGRPDARPEIEFLPVASRAGRIRFAAILGRTGRFQLQLVAESPTSFTLTTRDSSVPIGLGGEVEGQLPVGGTEFYRFQATPGQLLQASLTSKQFVPLLRLYNEQGGFVASSSEDSDVARVTHMVVNGGLYRLQISSVGDGGGGDYRIAFNEAKIAEIKIGDRSVGTLPSGATDFRTFEGKEGQTIFLSVRSTTFEPAVSLRSPDGTLLTSDNKGNAATGSLLAIKLPKTGRYTIWITSRRGTGDYTMRLIDGD